MNPRFYFSVCQVGAEKAVKAEVLAELPTLRLAFSRPGFITFKEADDDHAPLSLRRGIFTRLWGEVLDQAREAGALPELLARLPPRALVQAFDRDRYLPGDEPPGFVRNGQIRSILIDYPALLATVPPRFGDTVYSMIWVDDFHVFLTRHVHTDRLSGLPGNLVDLQLSPESPSRAYLKIEEAIRRFRPIIMPGALAFELGCAPGGATTALLDRGLSVVGIDPQFMDPRLLARPAFRHIRKAARYLTVDDLRGCDPDWLVMDMGITPNEALAELSHALHVLKAANGQNLRLRYGFLTLKLNDWKLASEIGGYLNRLERLGFHDLRATQLGANRQEFFVWAPRFDNR